MAQRRWHIALSVLLVSLCLSCNSSDPMEPAYEPSMDPSRLPAVALEHETVLAASHYSRR
jgi:hypothetical protein